MVKIDCEWINVQKCLCPTCSVQGESNCVKDKLKKLQEMMSKDIDIATMIEPKDIPGLYCATGKATCSDLYFHEECQCVNCSIWKENDLASGEPHGYFCRDGEAK